MMPVERAREARRRLVLGLGAHLVERLLQPKLVAIRTLMATQHESPASAAVRLFEMYERINPFGHRDMVLIVVAALELAEASGATTAHCGGEGDTR
jgi:hypothetical protein